MAHRHTHEQGKFIRLVSARINEAIRARDISQNEAARRAGLATSEMARIMNDQRPNMALWTAYRIAAALMVRLEWLTDGIPPRDVPQDDAPNEDDSSVRRISQPPASVR